jgi:nitrogen PTS system EIIA component
MLSDRPLRERLQNEPDAATLHRLIHDWHPAKTLA